MASTAPVLVLGAAGAAGAALCRRLAARGAPLALVGGRDAEAVRSLAGELGAPAARYVHPDGVDATLADGGASLKAAVDAAVRAGDGRLGGLAYCVGSINLKPLRRAAIADHMETYAVNVVGAAEALRHAHKALAKESDARRAAAEAEGAAPPFAPPGVVFFSSVAARAGLPNHTIISAAKAGVEGLAVAAAAELAPKVRVNAVAPSLSASAMAAPMLSNEAVAQGVAAAHPLRRTGLPTDLAAAADYLLGDGAGWVTGQVLAVDGGRGSIAGK